MGASTNPLQWVDRLDRLASEIKDQKAALNQTGMAGKVIFQRQAASAGVLGSTIAGKRRAIGARYDLTKDSRGVIVAYTGPAHLVNNPTSRHFIGAKRLGTRTGLRARSARVGAIAAFGGSNRGSFGSLRNVRNAKRALTIVGNLRAYAFHPGTKGKRFYEKARAACARTLPGIYGRAQLTQPLKEIFK